MSARMVPSQDISARYPARSKVPAAAAADKKRHMAASQPVDADDLRRRLYIVISEQNAVEEKRRTAKAQASAAAAKVAAAMRKPESPPQPPAAAPQPPPVVEQKPKEMTPPTPMHDITHWATQIVSALDHTSDFSPPWSKPHSPKSSETPEYKLHAKASSTPSSPGELTPGKGNMMCMYLNKPAGTVRPKSGSAYVPSNAASQFASTTTSDAMVENKTTHRLSMRQSSVPEGFNLMRRRANTLDLSEAQSRSTSKPLLSPTEKENRRSTMRPAMKGGREKEQRGNPFEIQVPPTDQSKRTSYRNSNMQSRRMTRDMDLLSSLGSPTGDRHISVQFEEPEMAHEPRADWTQSDECEKKKSGSRSPWKRDSRWGFMDRKLSKSSEGETSVVTTVSSSAANSPRSPPKGFLSRFSIRKQSAAATS